MPKKTAAATKNVKSTKSQAPTKSAPGADADALLQTLRARFEKNTRRHRGVSWETVEKKLRANAQKLSSLQAMEASGGEPDVVVLGKGSDELLFVDCAEESPKGRRSVCYDAEARAARKEHPPENSAGGMARAMGIELLDEEQYRALQALGEFDMKTSSWLLTPLAVRARGGAIFGDLRYGRVFIYHNGADSYYAARGFRGLLRI